MRVHALLPLALLALAGCSPAGDPAPAEAGKFAGLKPELAAWRTAIEAESPVCRAKTDGRGCQDFAVACKRERPITADEQAHGVTAKLVAAMTFQSRGADGKPGSAFAEFAKADGAWIRHPAEAVNVATCEAAPHAAT